MAYTFREIEAKWQQYWKDNQTFAAQDPDAKNFKENPKYFVLDMFPYPSGAGLHVGHPLGYIASDIYARYKRHKGFNVLHPMGYDSFGLPAEQYAILTGQHPAKTTKENISRYRKQLDRLGFSFDWNRELRTSDPNYYKWTQWIFLQLFDSWYDNTQDKARPINSLVKLFETQGNMQVNAACDAEVVLFSAAEWKSFSSTQKAKILLQYRLTYLADTVVNWCPELGTVLANDEIVNGVSERGGHPVVRKKMKQWMMRITAYAERLLQDLSELDWPLPLKDTQTNWIGKSKGASVRFQVVNHDKKIEVFTTRPDTIFGASFLVLAPEHEWVNTLTTAPQSQAVEAYQKDTAKRSERDRMAEVKRISGVFTGAYAIHPFTKKQLPIWIADYVLAGYGTGAVMAVPAGDERDHNFATHFGLEIPAIFNGIDTSTKAFAEKSGFTLAQSDFLNGLNYADATQTIITAIEQNKFGEGKVNYRLRDAVFSRQRYWGEPIPIYYKQGVPTPIEATHLPLELPEVKAYLPTETGAPPLAQAETWAWDENTKQVVSNELIDDAKGVYPLELNTMPGWAGSCCYFFRYTDPHNTKMLASPERLSYWGNADLYIGGSEHATGHLLYSRFWVKFLFDLGYLPVNEPAKKLINQGMILGESAFAYRISGTQTFVTATQASQHDTDKIHVPVDFVNNSNHLDVEALKANQTVFANAEFIMDNGVFTVSREVEKMSKSKYNVVNPDAICTQYGADTLRLYEMFLGPLDQAKPWNTAGITGVHAFLKKLWKLFHNTENGSFKLSDAPATTANLKTLHKTIKKVEEDIESFSFNTSVSTFMIAVNEWLAQKCNAREALEPFLIVIAPYAPHIAEELWQKLGHTSSITHASFPSWDQQYLIESQKKYPISFNGKMRFTLELPTDFSKDAIEAAVLAHDKTAQYLQGKTPKKIIVVPGKIVNIVC